MVKSEVKEEKSGARIGKSVASVAWLGNSIVFSVSSTT
jgi:hypothetical protein